MKKILIVSLNPYFPENMDGLNKITFNLLKHNPNFDCLSLFESTDHSLPLKNNYQSLNLKNNLSTKKILEKFKRVFNTTPLPKIPKDYLAKLADHLNSMYEKYDVFLFVGPQLARLGPLLSKQVIDKSVLSLVDSLPLYWHRRSKYTKNILFKFLFFMEYLKSIYYEKYYANFFNKIHFVSDVDVRFSQKNLDGECIFIPNGVDLPNIQITKKIDNKSLLFVANYEYGPNQEAAAFLINKLMPNLLKVDSEFKLTLIGKGLSKELMNCLPLNVTYKGYVEDISREYNSHSIFLCPLPYGSGIKNKVLEALYSGLTVIGTDISFDGINISDLSTHTINSFNSADWINAILQQSNAIQNNLPNIRSLLETRYSWSSIARAYINKVSLR